MVNELRTMLQDAVATPPEDAIDVHDLTRRGARARRRRTTVQTATAGLAVAAVVGGAALVSGLGSDQARPGPAQAPAGGTTLADATSYSGAAAVTLDPAVTGDAVLAGTTTDGLGLLWEENEGPDGYSVRLGLLDPATGEPTWLSDSGPMVTEPIELGRDRLVFLTEVARVGPQVAVYDRATSAWSTSTWDGLKGSFTGAAMGQEGRVWFDQGGRLVSGSLSDPTDLRDEGTRARLFDVDGDTLASLGTGREAGTLSITDLSSGDSRSFEIPGDGSRCGEPELDLGGDLVALGWSCGYSGNLADPQPTDARALVMTTDGDVVADVGGLPGNLRLDARVAGDDVLLTSPSPATSYDPDVCSFPFDGVPTRYLDAWSTRVDELAREQQTPDGWPYCQLSHQVYRELVLPHLDEARVPQDGYGYYVVDGGTGDLQQLTDSTPEPAGWSVSGDGRVVTGTGVYELP